MLNTKMVTNNNIVSMALSLKVKKKFKTTQTIIIKYTYIGRWSFWTTKKKK